MKKIVMLIFVLFFGLTTIGAASGGKAKKKILYIDSYHAEYPWSAGITAGIQKILSSRRDVELKIFWMDTKRHLSEDFKKAAALKAKALIESWQPDVVIASDDNASKYLIVPYYKDGTLPFVFCGVNWDAGEYGFPCCNVTGMVEVQLIDQIVATLKKYARGDRVAFLTGDDLSSHKQATSFASKFNINLDTKFVKNFAEWKMEYKRLQLETDMILLGNTGSITNWNGDKAQNVIRSYTEIPTGSWDIWMAQYSLVTFATKPEEQGEWAAQAALDILGGKSPQQIPLVSNKKSKIYLNMKIAKILGIRFPLELIENAHMISAAQKKLFYVNSYHKGYEWSDGIENGLMKALHVTAKPDGTFDTSQSDVEVKVFRMDTKINQSESYKKQSALAAKAIINSWQPDIVVTSDDNAAKYLLVPYYKKSTIPFVYCGINWDASGYGLPSSNSTGIVEVAPARETIAMLKKYAKGDRIGFIGSNTFSERKNIANVKKQLGISFADGKLVDTFSEWQNEYLRLQHTVDMLLWYNPVGIKGWDRKMAHEFILANTKIPTGGTSAHHMPYVLLGMVKIAGEQGWWAGKAALEILNGKSPADIPAATAKKFRLFLNMKLAKQMGIKFPMELIEKATFVDEESI